MASEDIVSKLYEFLYERYNSELQRAANNEAALVIDFNDFDRYDPITADMLLEAPQEVLDGFSEAAKRIVPEADVNIRIREIPERRNIRIRNLRSKHMDRLWCIDTVIKSATEVKPQIYEVVFQCPECDTKMTVKQDSNLVQKPSLCGAPYTEGGCGRRGDFNTVAKKMYDVRWLTGVEPFEVTEGDQPGEIPIFLKEDLTTPKMQKRTDPGNRLKIVGMLKEVPKRIKGKLSTKMDMMIEALHAEFSEMEFDDVEITGEDERMIKEMAADPKVYEKLVGSVAPGIYGFAEIKEAIALQLFGGVVHKLPDGAHIRGNIHILLTGDPGVGKSIMLKFVSDIMPRGRYVSGSGATGAGLTASVRKDEIMGGWLLEAGALILTNKSVICIDEFDKMGKDDQIAMHEAMSVESYHGDTKITLATGENVKIRDLVERILEENKTKIKKGDDCFFAEVNGPEILTTDFVGIKKAQAFRVSKHAAPEHFYRVMLQNDREVTVTPRHPFFVFDGKFFMTKPLEELKTGEFAPIPKRLPIEGDEQRITVESYRKAVQSPSKAYAAALKKLPKSDISLCAIKKIEKIKNETEEWSYDISVPGEVFVSHGMVLHNTISIAKASIVATLPAQTAVLAGANPKLGRFDPYLPIVEQIQIPETLLSRFDLKFALRDIPDRNMDERLAEHITISRITPEVVEPVIDAHTLRKYIAYAKQKIPMVELTKDAAEALKKFYVDMRNPGDNENATVSITLRQYEALLRLAEASAKVRLDNKIRPEDVERSIKLMKYSLSQLGYDYDTGKFDIDKMESGVTSSKRRKIGIITEIISSMEKRGGDISLEDVKASAEEQGVENADEIIDRLKREGTLFEPRPGFIKKA